MIIIIIAHISNDFGIWDRNVGKCGLLYLKSFQSNTMKNEILSICGVHVTTSSSAFSEVAKYASAWISHLDRHQSCFYNNLLTSCF